MVPKVGGSSPVLDKGRRPPPSRPPRPIGAGRLVQSGLDAAAGATDPGAATAAGVACPVVVVAGGARTCPRGVRRQQRVAPSLGTPPLRGPDMTHERADSSEHLVPRSFTCITRVSRPTAAEQGYLKRSRGTRCVANVPAGRKLALLAFALHDDVRSCPRRALADGYKRSPGVSHGLRRSALTSPFGARAGPACPLDAAFQARDRWATSGPHAGHERLDHSGQHRSPSGR